MVESGVWPRSAKGTPTTFFLWRWWSAPHILPLWQKVWPPEGGARGGIGKEWASTHTRQRSRCVTQAGTLTFVGHLAPRQLYVTLFVRAVQCYPRCGFSNINHRVVGVNQLVKGESHKMVLYKGIQNRGRPKQSQTSGERMSVGYFCRFSAAI